MSQSQTYHATRFPHAIAVGPSGGYAVAPLQAFDDVEEGQVNLTYPLLKQHKVIATGTKTECLRGALLIKKEERKTNRHVPVEIALKLLEKVAENEKDLDPAKCTLCRGEGEVFQNHYRRPCSLCEGSGSRLFGRKGK